MLPPAPDQRPPQPARSRTPLLIIGLLAALAVIAVVLVQGYRAFLSTRAPAPPELSDSIVGGRLSTEALPVGEHTLEFQAKTSDGAVISDSVVVTVTEPSADPYDPYEPDGEVEPNDPYEPIGGTDPYDPGDH